tara:strand:+ start:76 stop:273 length:198 start_codon:yes stop_codon:yes gene_type:complete
MTQGTKTITFDFDLATFIDALTDEAKLQAFMESSRWSAEDVTSAAEQVSQMIFDRLWSLHYRKTW